MVLTSKCISYVFDSFCFTCAERTFNCNSKLELHGHEHAPLCLDCKWGYDESLCVA